MTAFSYTPHTGDGVTKAFTFTFVGPEGEDGLIGYWDESQISVTVEGVPVLFEVTGPSQVTLDAAPASGDSILIKRNIDPSAPYSAFQRGNEFVKRVLNRSFQYILYLVQSVYDGFKPEGYYEKQDLNMGLHRVTNMADPIELDDAATKSYFDSRLGEAVALDSEFWATVATLAVGPITGYLSSIKDLETEVQLHRKTLVVNSFYEDEDTGGGTFWFDTTADKAEADGVFIVDPDAISSWDGTFSDLTAYFDAQGTGVGAGCWKRQNTYRITPAMCGSLPDRSFLNINSGPALSALQDVVNARGGGLIDIEDFYTSATRLVFDVEDITIRCTNPGKSGLYFPSSSGILVNQSTKNSICNTKSLLLIAGTDQTKKGFVYTNSIPNTGAGTPDRHLYPICIGLDRWLEDTNLNGWLEGMNFTNCDRVHLESPWMQGAENDRAEGVEFPTDTIGLSFTDCTGIFINDPEVFITVDAIKISGQCEGVFVHGGSLVANRKGISFNSTSAPCNEFSVRQTHMSCYDHCIDLQGSGGTSTTDFNNITGCLFFQRAETYLENASFTHVKLNGGKTAVSDNHFFIPTGLTGVGKTGVDVGPDGEFSNIHDNDFYRVGTLVNIQAGAVQVRTHDLIPHDDSSTILEDAIVDAGTSSLVGTVFGNRPGGNVYGERLVAPLNGGTGLSVRTASGIQDVLRVVSGYPDAENSIKMVNGGIGVAPEIQAEGLDTDVDLQLRGQGAGLVSVGHFVSAGDQTSDGYFTMQTIEGQKVRVLCKTTV